jgi:membrane protein implicated in regulation of membrane protease activity
VFLAAAIVLALYVVTNILFTSDLALWTAAAAVVVFAVLWYVLPMVVRPSEDEGSEDQADSPDTQAQESRGASSRR